MRRPHWFGLNLTTINVVLLSGGLLSFIAVRFGPTFRFYATVFLLLVALIALTVAGVRGSYRGWHDRNRKRSAISLGLLLIAFSMATALWPLVDRWFTVRALEWTGSQLSYNGYGSGLAYIAKPPVPVWNVVWGAEMTRALASVHSIVLQLRPSTANVQLALAARCKEMSGIGIDASLIEGADLELSPLRQCGSLQTVHVKGGRLSANDIQILADARSLIFLEINRSVCEEAELARLSNHPALELLLFDNDPITNIGVAHLARIPKLRELSLVSSKITDEGLRPLGQAQGLSRLCLSETKITDAGLLHLQGLPWLWGLELRSTLVTGPGLASLQKLPNLRFLELGSPAITDQSLLNLQAATQLLTLRLLKTQVTDAGIAQLKKSIPGLNVIRE